MKSQKENDKDFLFASTHSPVKKKSFWAGWHVPGGAGGEWYSEEGGVSLQRGHPHHP